MGNPFLKVFCSDREGWSRQETALADFLPENEREIY